MFQLGEPSNTFNRYPINVPQIELLFSGGQSTTFSKSISSSQDALDFFNDFEVNTMVLLLDRQNQVVAYLNYDSAQEILTDTTSFSKAVIINLISGIIIITQDQRGENQTFPYHYQHQKVVDFIRGMGGFTDIQLLDYVVKFSSFDTYSFADNGLTGYDYPEEQVLGKLEAQHRSLEVVYNGRKLTLSGDYDTQLADFFRQMVGNGLLVQEYSGAIFYDKTEKPIAFLLISVGGLSSTIIDIRIVLAAAIKCNAHSLVVFHNHPSGNLKPSEADKNITQKLANAAHTVGIKLSNHLIVTYQDNTSLYHTNRFLFEVSARLGSVLAGPNDELLQLALQELKAYEERHSLQVVEFPLQDIYTDTARFQNRNEAFSQRSFDRITQNFDIKKFDPIKVWFDPVSLKTYVLSGHTRLAAFKHLKKKSIPAIVFYGSEQEAIAFAKREANYLATEEELISQLRNFRIDYAELPRNQCKTKYPLYAKYVHWQYLHEGSKWLDILSTPLVKIQYPLIDLKAQWVGDLTKLHNLTKFHQNELFDYLFGAGKSLTKEAIYAKIENIVRLKNLNAEDFDSPLLIERNGLTTRKSPAAEDGYRLLQEIEGKMDEDKDLLKRVVTKEEKAVINKRLLEYQTEKDRILQSIGKAEKSQISLFGLGKPNSLPTAKQFLQEVEQFGFSVQNPPIKELPFSFQFTYLSAQQHWQNLHDSQAQSIVARYLSIFEENKHQFVLANDEIALMLSLWKVEDLGKISDYGNVPGFDRADFHRKGNQPELVINPLDNTLRVGEKISPQFFEKWGIFKEGNHYWVDETATQKITQFFGLHAIEFGNWVTQNDRASCLVALAMSLYDLQKILGVSYNKMGLNGRLSICYGSRGIANSKAHFNSYTYAININRYARGLSPVYIQQYLQSFVHEYGHALDYLHPSRIEGASAAASVGKRGAGKIADLTNEILDTLVQMPYYKRILAQDTLDEKTYFTLRTEMFARLFEKYINVQLKERGLFNACMAKFKHEGKDKTAKDSTVKNEVYLTDNEYRKVKPKVEQLLQLIAKSI